MKITYDPKADAMNITFQEGAYDVSKEIADGIIVDYAEDEAILAIEILDASKKMPLESIKDITIGLPMKKS